MFLIFSDETGTFCKCKTNYCGGRRRKYLGGEHSYSSSWGNIRRYVVCLLLGGFEGCQNRNEMFRFIMHTDKAIQPALVPADPWFALPPGDFEKRSATAVCGGNIT